MEWLIAILTIICTPALTLIGLIVSERTKLKTKRLEIDESNSKAIATCKESHKNDIAEVRKEFSGRLDEISKFLVDIKINQGKANTTIEELQKDVQKHNNVIERTFLLEGKVSALEAKIS